MGPLPAPIDLPEGLVVPELRWKYTAWASSHVGGAGTGSWEGMVWSGAILVEHRGGRGWGFRASHYLSLGALQSADGRMCCSELHEGRGSVSYLEAYYKLRISFVWNGDSLWDFPWQLLFLQVGAFLPNPLPFCSQPGPEWCCSAGSGHCGCAVGPCSPGALTSYPSSPHLLPGPCSPASGAVICNRK